MVLKGLLDPDNPVIHGIAKFGYIWLLNLLWLITSLPVFTIGASTTALIYSMMKLHDDSGYPVKNYFESFKSNFKQATAIWAVYGSIGVVLALDFILWHRINKSSIVTGAMIAIAIAWLATLLWVFAIQAKFVNKVKDTIHYAMIIACKHIKETVLMFITVVFIVYINISYTAAVNFFTIAIGPGLTAFLFAVFYENVFDGYIDKSFDPQNKPSQY